MSRKTSQKRIEANRRTAQGKAKSAHNSTTHGLSRLHVNPLAPGCFLKIEDENQFRILLDEYVATYNPNTATNSTYSPKASMPNGVSSVSG